VQKKNQVQKRKNEKTTRTVARRRRSLSGDRHNPLPE